MVTLTHTNPSSVGGLDQASGARAYYSIAEAASLLGVSRVSVWRVDPRGAAPSRAPGAPHGADQSPGYPATTDTEGGNRFHLVDTTAPYI